LDVAGGLAFMIGTITRGYAHSVAIG
jgi:hypothetical protein